MDSTLKVGTIYLLLNQERREMRKLFFLFTLIFVSQFALAQDENFTLNTGSIHWSVPAGNYDGRLYWPADYEVYGSRSVISYWGLVVACKDFQDSIAVKVCQTLYKLDHLNHSYFLSRDAEGNIIKSYYRYSIPELWVLDINNRDRDWNRSLQNRTNYEINPDLPSDQMVTSTCNTSIGLSVTQNAYAWANAQYDDFIIVEYIFTNTGNYDEDQDIENPQNQLHDVYIGLQSMSQVSGLGSIVVDKNGGILEGNDDWVDFYGEEPSDSLRVIYSWDGDASPNFSSGNDEGDPHPLTGQPLSPQYLGRAVLYVDQAVDNHIDNPNQPITTHLGNWKNLSSQLSLAQLGTDEAVYNKLDAGTHIEEPFDWSIGQYTAGNIYATDEFLKTATMAFGPYEFTAVGQSIRIVTCLAVGSIGFKRGMELGIQHSPGTDEYLQVIRTGRDSLFATISKARRLFYDQNTGSWDFTIAKGSTIDRKIKDPLQAPSVHYYSDSARVRITWQDVSQEPDPDTGELDWAGYRVYRRVMPYFDLVTLIDLPYAKIYESTDTTTFYNDYDVDVGRCYWYYVTAFDKDGVESNRFLNRSEPGGVGQETRQGACAFRTQADNLINVIVVPNPYQVHGVRLNTGTPNTLNFFNLPYKCRLRIYNQTGDLLWAYHKESPDNVVSWSQISNANQYIVSGLYIFVVDEAETEDGRNLGKTMGKFVVIR